MNRLIATLIVAVSLTLVSTANGQTFIGPKVDNSFEVHGFAPVTASNGQFGFLSVVYFKMVNYKGKIAICRSYTGGIFDSRNNKLFLRSGRIITKIALAANLTYLQRIEDFSEQQSKGKAIGEGEIFDALRSYGKGLPTKCKVSKRAWIPEFTEPKLRISLPTNRITWRKI